MCRMLESQMNYETKAYLLARIENLEKHGLCYQQHGETIASSKAVDLITLVNALERYAACYKIWEQATPIDRTVAWHDLHIAWLQIGKAQRQVPAHVAHEYCNKGRLFDPVLEFNEAKLPRSFQFYEDGRLNACFPLSSGEGLGFYFSMIRAIMLMATPAKLKSGVHLWTGCYQQNPMRWQSGIWMRSGIEIVCSHGKIWSQRRPPMLLRCVLRCRLRVQTLIQADPMPLLELRGE